MDDFAEPTLWRGKPIEELTREEAVSAVRQLGRQLARLQAMPIDYRAVVRRRLGYEPARLCADCGCDAGSPAFPSGEHAVCPFGMTACPFVRSRQAGFPLNADQGPARRGV